MTEKVKNVISQSLEKLGYDIEWKDCIDLYYRIKELKLKYRFLPPRMEERFLRQKSKRSLILKYQKLILIK